MSKVDVNINIATNDPIQASQPAIPDSTVPNTIAIAGKPGTARALQKPVNGPNVLTDAQLHKLEGLAGRLPVPAFDALVDPEIIEILLNPDGRVWRERLGFRMEHICDMPAAEAEDFIRRVAGYRNTTVTWENPRLEAALPLDDSRFAGQIPPVVDNPAFSIRKRAVKVFTLEEYVADGIMTPEQCRLIRWAVADKRNILIVGGTGSGKTTLGNAILNEITLSDPDARQIIIEDTAELQSTALNRVNFQVSETTSMTDLIRTTLRMRPDRVIVGEVRGPEAFDLLQAWNTGHPGGLATLHANDCLSGLRRLKSLVSQHEFAPRDIEPDIALAVNVLVDIVKADGTRRVREIVAIEDYEEGRSGHYGYRIKVLSKEEINRTSA
ncbi:MAG: P-type conjugative transfer ATPase TrbB [Planctomycetota bacterium]|jgi:type IV secretion system protein VirB11|nr:P-type conjugative transfer ATPase TrbB [Planctomycetota bacterium]